MSIQLTNETVSRSISKLYLDVDLTDVIFVFKTNDLVEEVSAHKLILAAASPVFHKMFFGLINSGRYIRISDATVNGFKAFLQFFYKDNVVVTMEHIEEILNLAGKYVMPDCINTCINFIKNQLTIDNVCWGYRIAIMLDNEDLKRYCEKFITISPIDVFRTVSFLNCERNVLKHILRMDLMICKESELFAACLSWAANSCKRNNLDESKVCNLKNQLNECFALIRFGAMTPDEFIEITKKYREFFQTVDFATISLNFGQIPRTNTLIHWNKNRELLCWRENTVAGSPHYIKNVESVWFSANEPLLLGGLWCKGLIHRYSHLVSVDFNVCILEINSQSFDADAPSEIIFTGLLTLIKKVKSRISIPQPLVICPQKMYEIRLSTKSSGYYYHCAIWSTEVKLDDDINVTFHSNPNVKENERSGLVSCFSFKRI